MAKQWKHWVRVVEDNSANDAQDRANRIINDTQFDAVVPRVCTAVSEGYLYTTILLYFRKQVEVDE